MLIKLEQKVFIPSERVAGIVKEIDTKENKCLVTFFKDDVRNTLWFDINEVTKYRKKDELLFAKVRPEAIIPSKRLEDAGFDLYPCFEQDYIEIEPHETKLIPTGIASCFSSKYVLVLKERGSTGTKGLGQRCGIVDSGYRNEIFTPITNHNNYPIYIAKENVVIPDNVYNAIYPYSKAICQALLVPVPNVKVKEISYETLKNIPSQRGMGHTGSSGK